MSLSNHPGRILTVYWSANLATMIPVPDQMCITCFIASVTFTNKRDSEKLHSLLWSFSTKKTEKGLVSAFPPLRRAPCPVMLVFVKRNSWLVS